jgi:hypothetical protein
MNMQKGTLTLGAGVYAVGVQSQSGTETSLTHKIGALKATASDAQLGTGTWNVGYLNTNTTFAGIVGTSATLTKVGTGVLTLTGQSTGKVTVSGGMVCGTGAVGSVTVSKDGTVGAGNAIGTVGTLTITGNLSVQNGGAIRIRGQQTDRTDALKVGGKVTLNNPLFRMERVSGEWQPDTDYQVFTGNGTITLTGIPTFEPAVPMQGCEWDYSALATEGVIRVKSNTTAIETPGNGDLSTKDATYDLQGRKRDAGNWNSSPARKGIYIRQGKKRYVK